MMSKRRKLLVVTLVASVFIVAWLVLAWDCPRIGIAFTSKSRNLHRLKNRTGTPLESDFDPRVTLDELLRPGDDRSRWSTDRAARIQGQVLDVAYARPEATNCFSPCRRDLHIVVANRAGAPKNEQVVVEVTPNVRNAGWSDKTLEAELVGHWCEFEGWLFFDEGHADQSENINPHDATNWRATAWELHPVVRITVIK